MTTTEAKAREFAKQHGYTILRTPHSQEHQNGFIKVIDSAGNERTVEDIHSALSLMKFYGDYPFTTPVYLVGVKWEPYRVRVVAKNSNEAKRKFCKLTGRIHNDPWTGVSILEAKKVKVKPDG